MIYASLTTIPSRVKNLYKSVESLLGQTLKPDKIFINIPIKYRRFKETIEEDKIPKFDNNRIEITRCEDYGPGTKLLGSLKKIQKNSLLILVDDDNIYEDYMIEKFYYYYSKAPENAYSFYVHPLGNFGVGQGADGFAINTNNLEKVEIFYKNFIKDHKDLFLHDDLWISYFLYFYKKNKILSLQQNLKKDSHGKVSLIYKNHAKDSGLIQKYGHDLISAVKKRDEIALESLKYLIEKGQKNNF